MCEKKVIRTRENLRENKEKENEGGVGKLKRE